MSDNEKTWCPQCGFDAKCDGDGCCVACGCDTGLVPDWRKLQADRDEARARIAELERELADVIKDRRENWHRR